MPNQFAARAAWFEIASQLSTIPKAPLVFGAKFLSDMKVFAQMRIHKAIFLWLLFFAAGKGFALEPNEILIIANSDIAESVEIAQYYCGKRGVPKENILALSLGPSFYDVITRANYDRKLAEPIRNELNRRGFANKIRCLLTIYGVPIKVGRRGQLKGQEEKLAQLRKMVGDGKAEIARLEQSGAADAAKRKKKINQQLTRLQSTIDFIVGKETNASVDSELSMVLSGDYKLYRWQPNSLKGMWPYWDFKTLMVCRLDGPGFQIARNLVDKSLIAEKTGLGRRGVAYIDSRGLADDKKPYSFGHFDQSLRELAVFLKYQVEMPVEHEMTEKLFAPGACPQTAIYCGWYSLKKYVDSFDFANGAIGYHISSWEAIDLRDPNSSQWCPSMLKNGITATMGAVAEPYLHSFPKPKEFFAELFDGKCLVEAYYQTKPFNSWQLILIGDPLYRPFKKR